MINSTSQQNSRDNIYDQIDEFLQRKAQGEPDINSLRSIKGIIRKGEAFNTCRFVGIPKEQVHYFGNAIL